MSTTPLPDLFATLARQLKHYPKNSTLGPANLYLANHGWQLIPSRMLNCGSFESAQQMAMAYAIHLAEQDDLAGVITFLQYYLAGDQEALIDTFPDLPDGLFDQTHTLS